MYKKKNDSAALQSIASSKTSVKQDKTMWSFAEHWCGHAQKAGHVAGVQWQQVLLFLNGICVSRPD